MHLLSNHWKPKITLAICFARKDISLYFALVRYCDAVTYERMPTFMHLLSTSLKRSFADKDCQAPWNINALRCSHKANSEQASKRWKSLWRESSWCDHVLVLCWVIVLLFKVLSAFGQYKCPRVMPEFGTLCRHVWNSKWTRSLPALPSPISRDGYT